MLLREDLPLLWTHDYTGRTIVPIQSGSIDQRQLNDAHRCVPAPTT